MSQTDSSCGRCGAPVAPGRRYCARCGARVAQWTAAPGSCPRCAYANAPNDGFCGGCGLALAADLAEWRQLTVMFADLVGSTEMSAVLDPEDLRDVNRAYQVAVTASIERFGGFVARYMGDGVLAYFGWPTAHEDDPERAVRAGLAAVDAMRDLDATVGRRHGVVIAARFGIATGRVVVGDLIGAGAAQEAAVVGTTPNLAARLQGQAEPNQVVISESTRRRLGRGFAVRSLGARPLKGIAEPTEIFEVRGEATAATAHAAPLLGRDADLWWLEREWVRAAGGAGNVALISGEAGIGKSHLLSAFLADRPAVLLQAAALQASTALHPLLTWVRRRAGIHPGDDVATQRARVDGLDWGGPDAAALIRWGLDLEPGEVSDAEQRAERLRGVLVDAVLAGGSGPRAVVLEDAHWSDPSTLVWLDRLISAIAELPVLVVISFRPAFVPPWSGSAVARRDLTRVDEAGARALIASVAGGPLPEAVVAHVVAKTDGVPLFVEELTRTLLDSGQLEREGDGWRLVGSLDELSVPGTLEDSLMARLDQLGYVKALAQAAAVIGRRFTRALLDAVSDLPPSHVDVALERLVEARLVQPDGDGYAFRHALLQETAATSLLRARRRAIHSRVADAMATAGDTEPDQLAHHLTEAGRSVEAIAAWRQAAELAARRFANAEAIELWRRGIAVAEAADPSDVDAAIALRMRIGERLRMIERFDDAHAVLDEAAAHAEARGDVGALSQIHFHHGNAYFHAMQLDRCLASHTLAGEYAERAGLPHLQVAALGGLADALYLNSRYAEARETFIRCVEVAEAHGLDQVEVANRPMIGWAAMHLGRLDEAARVAEVAVARAEQVGHQRALIVALGLQAFHACESGRPDLVVATASRSRELSVQLGSGTFVAAGYLYEAFAHVITGDRAACRDLVGKARAAVESGGGGHFVSAALHGVMACATDDLDLRRAELVAGAARSAQRTMFVGAYWFRRFAIDACLDVGWHDDALEHAAGLEAMVQTDGIRLVAFQVDRARALVSRDPDALAAALALGREMGMVWACVALERALASP